MDNPALKQLGVGSSENIVRQDLHEPVDYGYDQFKKNKEEVIRKPGTFEAFKGKGVRIQ